jgi:ribonuclease HI
MVRVIAGGGARPNPGSAGCGAVIRQNGKCTFTFGHYDHATNNAMEIRAVVEALRDLPERMHVWGETKLEPLSAIISFDGRAVQMNFSPNAGNRDFERKVEENGNIPREIYRLVINGHGENYIPPKSGLRNQQ